MLASFTEAGVSVVGVSVDTLKTLHGFAAKYDLAFPLVSDVSREIGEAYGVLKDNASRSAARSTFVIGSDGVILRTYENVAAAGHADQVLADVRAMAL